MLVGLALWVSAWACALYDRRTTLLSILLIGIFAGAGSVAAGVRIGCKDWKDWVPVALLACWAVYIGQIVREHWSTLDTLKVGLAFFGGVLLAGVTLSFFSPPGVVVRLKSWLKTSQRKQLTVLLAAAAWVSLVTLFETSERDAMSKIMVYCTPVLLFGAVLFWWFGPKEAINAEGTGAGPQNNAIPTPPPMIGTQEGEITPSSVINRHEIVDAFAVKSTRQQPQPDIQGAIPPTNSVAHPAAKPTAVEVEPNQSRPYRWGNFLGGLLALGSALFAILGFLTLLVSNDPTERAHVEEGLVATVVFFPMGFGIVRKRRYGLILVYAFFFLLTLSVLFALIQGWDSAYKAAVGTGIWCHSVIYFHRRRHEFQ
jgi:hypothetical protein